MLLQEEKVTGLSEEGLKIQLQSAELRNPIQTRLATIFLEDKMIELLGRSTQVEARVTSVRLI
jgi:hypothetical protein